MPIAHICGDAPPLFRGFWRHGHGNVNTHRHTRTNSPNCCVVCIPRFISWKRCPNFSALPQNLPGTQHRFQRTFNVVTHSCRIFAVPLIFEKLTYEYTYTMMLLLLQHPYCMRAVDASRSRGIKWKWTSKKFLNCIAFFSTFS